MLCAFRKHLVCALRTYKWTWHTGFPSKTALEKPIWEQAWVIKVWIIPQCFNKDLNLYCKLGFYRAETMGMSSVYGQVYIDWHFPSQCLGNPVALAITILICVCASRRKSKVIFSSESSRGREGVCSRVLSWSLFFEVEVRRSHANFQSCFSLLLQFYQK